jgi:hypothetical protein
MNSALKKGIFLTAIVAFGLSLSSSMLYTGLIDGKGKNSTIASNFGAAYGIHDIANSEGDGLEGLPSNTVTFQVSDSSTSEALAFTSRFLAEETDAENGNGLLNLKISSDSESSKKFNLEFYANSPTDYLDGEFDETLKTLNNLIEGDEFSNVTLISKPTSDGSRSIDVSTNVSTGTNTSPAEKMRVGWGSLLAAVKEFPLNGSRHNLSIAIAGDIRSSATAFYFDEASFNALAQVDPQVWKTLETYTGTEFSSLGVAEVKYVIAQGLGGNDSAFRITLAGDQPDATTVTAMIKNFTSQAYANPNVLLPWANITTLKYATAPEAAHIEFPTNMIW